MFLRLRDMDPRNAYRRMATCKTNLFAEFAPLHNKKPDEEAVKAAGAEESFLASAIRPGFFPISARRSNQCGG